MPRYLALLMLAILLQACDPFEAMTTDMDIAIPDDRVGEVELLLPGSRLPASARNVRIKYLHFQDSHLRVRFEAPLTDAIKFAEEHTGLKLANGCGTLVSHNSDIAWWLKECPNGAQFADMRWSENPPARQVVVVPDGVRATVWLSSFTT